MTTSSKKAYEEWQNGILAQMPSNTPPKQEERRVYHANVWVTEAIKKFGGTMELAKRVGVTQGYIRNVAKGYSVLNKILEDNIQKQLDLLVQENTGDVIVE